MKLFGGVWVGDGLVRLVIAAYYFGTMLGLGGLGPALDGLRSGVRAPAASGPMVGLEVGEPAVVGSGLVDWWRDGRCHG